MDSVIGSYYGAAVYVGKWRLSLKQRVALQAKHAVGNAVGTAQSVGRTAIFIAVFATRAR